MNKIIYKGMNETLNICSEMVVVDNNAVTFIVMDIKVTNTNRLSHVIYDPIFNAFLFCVNLYRCFTIFMKIICRGFIDIFFLKLFLLVRESIKEA